MTPEEIRLLDEMLERKLNPIKKSMRNLTKKIDNLENVNSYLTGKTEIMQAMLFDHNNTPNYYNQKRGITGGQRISSGNSVIEDEDSFQEGSEAWD